MGEFMRDQWDNAIQSMKLVKRECVIPAHWTKEMP
jgi:hypothetical protein